MQNVSGYRRKNGTYVSPYERKGDHASGKSNVGNSYERGKTSNKSKEPLNKSPWGSNGFNAYDFTKELYEIENEYSDINSYIVDGRVISFDCDAPNVKVKPKPRPEKTYTERLKKLKNYCDEKRRKALEIYDRHNIKNPDTERDLKYTLKVIEDFYQKHKERLLNEYL